MSWRVDAKGAVQRALDLPRRVVGLGTELTRGQGYQRGDRGQVVVGGVPQREIRHLRTTYGTIEFAQEHTGLHVEARAARIVFECTPRLVERQFAQQAGADEFVPHTADFRARALEPRHGKFPSRDRRFGSIREREAWRWFDAAIVATLLGRRSHRVVDRDTVAGAIEEPVLGQPRRHLRAPEAAEWFAERTGVTAIRDSNPLALEEIDVHAASLHRRARRFVQLRYLPGSIVLVSWAATNAVRNVAICCAAFSDHTAATTHIAIVPKRLRPQRRQCVGEQQRNNQRRVQEAFVVQGEACRYKYRPEVAGGTG